MRDINGLMNRMNYNKFENYVRVGHKEDGSDLQPFPTPSAIGWALHDVDKDPFTDLQGYTHRNRVRHDVIDIAFTYPVLSEEDESYILKRISPEWIYIELKDKKTLERTIYKCYASDKTWNTWLVWQKPDGSFSEESIDFAVSFVQQ